MALIRRTAGGGTVAGPIYSPVTLTAVSGVITPDATKGYGPHRHTATTNVTLAAPTGGLDGEPLEVQVTASGADRALTVAGDTVTLTSGTTWWGHFSYRQSDDKWLLDDSGSGSSSGSGAVASVNGQTGAVVLDADDLADGSAKVQMAAAERTKLTGVATGATANSSDAQLRDRATHTGTQSADTLTDGTTAKAFLATERTKLTGVATGATANSSDATLLARANHTGTQAASTITGLATIATSGSATDLASGTVPTARLGSGTASATTFHRGDQTWADPSLLAPLVHAVGNSGTALTIDASSTSGWTKTITLTGNCTFTLTGATSGRATTLELVLTQDATGSRTVTWPASVKWSGGAPTLSTAAAAVDRIVLTTYNAGTTWYADLIGKGYA